MTKRKLATTDVHAMMPDREEHRFPVDKSFLRAESLASRIEAAYGLSAVRCQLITATMRDVYLVTSQEQRCVLYVYRAGQRLPAQILSEWTFVDFLHKHGIPVAPAIRRLNGELLMSFDAPEGTRPAVLTPFVEGQHLRHRPNIRAVQEYGRIVAQIHALTDGMPSDLTRPVNDWSMLVGPSIGNLDSVLTLGAADKAYLRSVATTLRSRMAGFPREKPLFGMIHGDVIRANAQVSDRGAVTVLDFDLCGLGWRAYDVACYLLVAKGLADGDAQERAFLDGYQDIRPLTRFEQEALPVFEAVRAIFDLGVKAANVYHWGSSYLDAFLAQSMEQLRQLMQSLP